MLKTVKIEIDDNLIQEVIRQYHLADAREAVHLALRVLLAEDGDEYDEFSDLSAWQPHRNSDTG